MTHNIDKKQGMQVWMYIDYEKKDKLMFNMNLNILSCSSLATTKTALL